MKWAPGVNFNTMAREVQQSGNTAQFSPTLRMSADAAHVDPRGSVRRWWTAPSESPGVGESGAHYQR
jgi:hypothetical protein